MTKFKKGDLVRGCAGHVLGAKALVIDDFPQPNIQSVRVLWLNGEWEGKTTWEGPDWLRKIEVESEQTE